MWLMFPCEAYDSTMSSIAFASTRGSGRDGAGGEPSGVSAMIRRTIAVGARLRLNWPAGARRSPFDRRHTDDRRAVTTGGGAPDGPHRGLAGPCARSVRIGLDERLGVVAAD